MIERFDVKHHALQPAPRQRIDVRIHLVSANSSVVIPAIQEFLNRHFGYRPAFDRRHIFVATYTHRIPFFHL
jgi:hypothetical protein